MLFRKEALESRHYHVQGEIILPHGVAPWMLIAFLFSIIISGAAWAAITDFSRIEIISGALISDKPIIKIIPPATGTIISLPVSDGMAVQAGAILASISTQPADQAGEAENMAVLRQRFAAEDKLSFESQRGLNDNNRMRTTYDGGNRQLLELIAQIEVQKELVVSTKTTFSDLRKLLENGFVSRGDYERRRQEALRAEQQLRQLLAQRAALETTQAQILIDLARMPIEKRIRESDLTSDIASLEARQAALSGSARYDVRSPISGQVASLQTARGKLADGRSPLMTIAPHGVSLKAELFAPSKAIGFIKVGQPVKLRYDAFPYKRFGSFDGVVESVSRTILLPSEIDTAAAFKVPAYRVIVSVQDQSIIYNSEKIPLRIGMTLEGAIFLEQRSLFSWFFEPLASLSKRV